MTSTNKKLSGTEVTFALVDQAFSTASIFRPRGYKVKKEEKEVSPKESMIVPLKFGDYNFKFTCFEWPGAAHQSVLWGLVGLAGLASLPLRPAATGEIGKQLWANLRPEDEALQGFGIVITTTRSNLIKASGLSVSGQAYDTLDDILYTLSQIGCHVKKINGGSWAMHLLSYHEKPSGELYIALNERFAKAIGLEGAFTRISMIERNELTTEAGQILHSWLTSVIKAGESGLWTGLDTLAIKIWGNKKISDSALRSRRQRIKKAITEMESVGWKFEHRGVGSRHQVRAIRPND